jgi:HEAT repeat protein
MFTTNQLTREARQILITEVEKGSPSDGLIQVGDVILGLNGEHFSRDARRSFGEALDIAEPKGRLDLLVWRPDPSAKTRTGTTQTISIPLPKQIPFAESAPFDCERSRQLMNASLDRVEAMVQKGQIGRLGENLLALLAGGRPEHLQLVRDYLHKEEWASPDYTIGLETGGLVVWKNGIRGLVLSEYYLLTEDEYVLPALKEHAVKVAMGQGGNGTWGHGFAWLTYNDGQMNGVLKGYGGLNLAGLPCLLNMTLAERCGITDPHIEAGLDRGLTFFSSFVGHGTIGYGYHRPSLDIYNNGHNGYGSNGKNAIASLIYAAAGDKKVSNYFSMLMTSSYDESEYGHAGNTFKQFWEMMGVNAGGPEAVIAYHKKRRWYYALGRGWDGRIMYQKLGGYYGGVTVNLDASRVMRNALPLRKLMITGRDAKQDLWLSTEQVQEAIKAGSWHHADYSQYSNDELIAALDCWLPGGREWIAMELAKREGVVPSLMKTLTSDVADQRAGACAALGYQREKAAPAVDGLIACLSDSAPQVQVAASHALMRVGKPAYRAVPEMMKVITTLNEKEPLEPVLQAMAYCLSAPPSRWAPLYFDGILSTMPQDPNPLKDMDREILYPALRRLISANSARVRLCGTSLFRLLEEEDVVALGSEIYAATRYRAPNMPMFEDLARREGMDLMEKFHIIEGVGLTTHSLITPKWGSQWREPHHFEVLQRYGQAAESALPELKQNRWARRASPSRELLEATISTIENDRESRNSRSLLDMVENDFQANLPENAQDDQLVTHCRESIAERPHAHLRRIAALRILVNKLGEASAPDLADALKQPSDLLREHVIDLACGLKASRALAHHWETFLKNTSDPQQLKGLLRLVGRTRHAGMDLIIPFLDHADEQVRRTAMLALGDYGGKPALDLLMQRLGDTLNNRELRDLETALSHCYQSIDNPMATWPKETLPRVRASLVMAYGLMDTTQVVEDLLSLLEEDSGLVRTTVLDRLALSHQSGIIDRMLPIAQKEMDARRRHELLTVIFQRIICESEADRDTVSDLQSLMMCCQDRRMQEDILAELTWFPNEQALSLISDFIQQTAGENQVLINAAAQAAVDVCRQLNETSVPKGKMAILLESVLQKKISEELADEARQLLAGYAQPQHAK